MTYFRMRTRDKCQGVNNHFGGSSSSCLLHLTSQLKLGCLQTYTEVSLKLHWAPLKIHWSASQVTLGCLQTYTGVPLKLHWCASQLTLGCLLFYIDVPPNLHWSTSQLTLIGFPLHWFASQLTVGLKNGIDLLQLTPPPSKIIIYIWHLLLLSLIYS